MIPVKYMMPIILVLLMISAIAVHVLESRIKQKDELQRFLSELKITLKLSWVFWLFLVIFILPQTAVLGSFGYPQNVLDIDSPEKILHYLQEYNDAIVSISYTIFFLIMTITFWMTSRLSKLIDMVIKILHKKEIDN